MLQRVIAAAVLAAPMILPFTWATALAHADRQGFLDFIHSQGVPSGYFGTAGADYSNIKAAEMICDVFHNGGTEADIPFLGFQQTGGCGCVGVELDDRGREITDVSVFHNEA
jgi:hypothetical protein